MPVDVDVVVDVDVYDHVHDEMQSAVYRWFMTALDSRFELPYREGIQRGFGS